MRTLLADLRVVSCLVKGNRGADHAERLDHFYRPQAADYDRFRERLLHGREDLIERLTPRPGERFAELGAGTGRNLEYFGEHLHRLERFDLVDLCEPLLEQARERCRDWPNVRVLHADAAEYRPEGTLDAVYFSYSLSMMPNWRQVLETQASTLRPGTRIGVVDFFVSSPSPAPGRARHGWFARTIWPLWFGHDGVTLGPDLPDFLLDHFRHASLTEHTACLPWLPAARVPYFLFTAVV